jgi:ribosomal protein L40E
MPQESLGFVKLEWTCPKCGVRNPGPQKTCGGCGAPQPENVQFEQAEHQELIKDQAEIENAKAGPDIHCPFCGTRNPAGIKVCTQCGGDLSQGKQREVGRVVGAFSTGPVKQITCPRCSATNPETALQCARCGAPLAKTPVTAPAAVPQVPAKGKPSPWMMGLGIAVAVVCVCAVIGFMVFAMRTEGKNGVVQSVQWESRIAVEALQPVAHEDWKDEIPVDAEVGTCTQKLHHVQDDPAPNSNKVCGTPYSVDKGSGVAEVVQDCQYEVYQDYCEYTVMDWQQVDEFTSTGNDFSPAWPEVKLTGEQREGQRDQIYMIVFETSDKQYTYTTSDSNLFQQCQIGSQWVLNTNGLGQIVSVEPAK